MPTPLISPLVSPQYSSQGSRDGYFEMSLDESVEETVCPPTPSLAANEFSGHQREGLCQEEEEEEAKEEDVKICRVLWCYCLQVEEEVEQREACLVLCDQLVGLFFLPGDCIWTGELKGKLANGNLLSYIFTYKDK